MGVAEYPDWKKVIWRFVRSGIAGGAGSAISTQILLNPNWTNSKEYFLVLTSAFVTGFIAAIFLAIRNEWGEPDNTGIVNKLPL